MIDEFEKKFSNLQEKVHQTQKEDNKNSKSVGQNKQNEIQKAKLVLNNMMTKINAKNISEELSPIANEIILNYIHSMDSEL